MYLVTGVASGRSRRGGAGNGGQNRATHMHGQHDQADPVAIICTGREAPHSMGMLISESTMIMTSSACTVRLLDTEQMMSEARRSSLTCISPDATVHVCCPR